MTHTSDVEEIHGTICPAGYDYLLNVIAAKNADI
jgi:hypothetical protein